MIVCYSFNMKKIYILLLFLIGTNLYSQYYKVSDFNLKGNLNRVSVICYDIEDVNGEFLEGLPYSSQNRYHTDLNLHYLEFNRDGQLIRSKLYYPRDFYGQFSWLSPQFDLESSDFLTKKNYLAAMHRYKYLLEDDVLKITITSEDGSEVDVILDEKKSLMEDEYYTYTTTLEDNKQTLTKKRKGSMYGFRRLETVREGNRTTINEFINNRFLVSKKVVTVMDDYTDTIFVSQSRIELSRIKSKNDKVLNKRYVNLSWRNKFLKWPEIDFNIDQSYSDFLESLERQSEEYGEEYTYSISGKLTSLTRYRYSYDIKKPILNIDYAYKEDLLQSILINSNPQGVSDLYFKEYIYDDKDNWSTKTVGLYKMIKGKRVRIPTKKYVKTLTYWN